MDNLEDHFKSIRVEWHALKEKWFHGETIDPVFEGTVRDFCAFDDAMQNVHQKVGVFMKGVEQLANGMIQLSDGVSTGLSHSNDSQIASDSCKLKEATNQIARSDAPHSAIAKLRRDMNFNILNPVQNHIANNRNIKVNLDIRRRRLVELNAAKKLYEEQVKRNPPAHDKKFLQAQAHFESAKMTFNDVDRCVFEWLYILEEYRGDILDSTLQTLKYLEYEFFATSAHAISTSLPSRMEFRPMVEMTPEHLEAQVELELQEDEQREGTGRGVGGSGAEAQVADFSARLIDKKVKEEPEDSGPAVAVDPLSLCSLLSQGFEEGPARRALRMHQNDTQAALDWLINGQGQEAEKKKQVEEGVRMPTTVKHVKKLKAMRKAQQERNREKRGDNREGRDGGEDERARPQQPSENSPSAAAGGDPPRDGAAAPASAGEQAQKPPTAPVDLMDMVGGDDVEAPIATRSTAATMDLLNMDESAPAVTTDMSKPIVRTELPEHISFDMSRCEKQPLPASVAAGTAALRAPAAGGDSPMGTTAQAGPPPSAMSGDLMAQVQALAAQTNVSPEQLLLAAQQLARQQPAPAQPAAQAPGPAALAPLGGYPPSPQATSPGAFASGAVPASGAGQPRTASAFSAATFQGLDPLGSEAPADGGPTAAAPKPKDTFSDLGLLSGGS